MEDREDKALQAYRENNKKVHAEENMAALKFRVAVELFRFKLNQVFADSHLVQIVVDKVIDQSWSHASPANYVDDVSEKYIALGLMGMSLSALDGYNGQTVSSVVVEAYQWSMKSTISAKEMIALLREM